MNDDKEIKNTTKKQQQQEKKKVSEMSYSYTFSFKLTILHT